MPATTYGRIAAGAALEPLRRRPDTLPERERRRDGIAVDRRLAAHGRGRTVDIVAEGHVDGELAWRDCSPYLHREAQRNGPGPTVQRNGPDPVRATAEWDVAGDIGRRYAAVSGDRNPIHLHGLAARLFGQKAAIAHGMWTKARCLAALQGHLPAAFSVEVAFKLPVLLPAQLAFASWTDGDVRRFALRDARDGKPHVEGNVSPSASPAA